MAGCASRGGGNALGRLDSAVAGRGVGGVRDGHGCLTAAGYAWSEVRQDCIRPFEQGVKMVPADDPGAVFAGYIVFSLDSLQAELFLPGDSVGVVLDRRRLPGGGSAWNQEDDDTKNVRRVDGRWIIEQRGRLLYRQDTTSLPIYAVFQGRDNRGGPSCRVDVTFCPVTGTAVVGYDGQTYALRQYVTGSGYGYRNDSVDLRGKGAEATLTLPGAVLIRLEQQED